MNLQPVKLVNSLLSSKTALSFIGHCGLIASAIAGHFRRNTSETSSTFFMLLGGVCLVASLGLFILRPRLFFFSKSDESITTLNTNWIIKSLTWCFVVVTPVGLLLLTIFLQDTVQPDIARRLLSSYLLYAWVAASIIISPYLFAKRGK